MTKKTTEPNYPIEPKLENFEALAEYYRPLILGVIKTYSPRDWRIEFDDMYQEALLALHRSLELFNPEIGVYFSVYFKKAVINRVRMFSRDFAPHCYTKDLEKSTKEKPRFKRLSVQVGSFDDLIETGHR